MISPATDTNQHADTVTVTVFAPNNAHHEFTVEATERVDKLARTAVDFFVHSGQMQPADCGLAVVRDGVATPLDDASRLDEDGIHTGAELKLLVKKPKTDGAGRKL
ncbi:MAG: hypothetical protein ACHP9Z_03195 [Streptosporangiales bacterium]